jgi:hypothetical protein
MPRVKPNFRLNLKFKRNLLGISVPNRSCRSSQFVSPFLPVHLKFSYIFQLQSNLQSPGHNIIQVVLLNFVFILCTFVLSAKRRAHQTPSK